MKRILLALLLGISFQGKAQNLSDTIKEVEITGRQWHLMDQRQQLFAPATKVDSVDVKSGLVILQSVGEILQQQLPVYIHSFGINGLATMSLRGASAQQSQVIWNGVPLNNTAQGVSDVSLIPAIVSNRVSLAYSNSAALWGSGNVGGALILQDDLPQFAPIHLRVKSSAGLGHFGHRANATQLQLANPKWQINLNAFSRTATNDFYYRDRGQILTKQTHAEIQSSGIITDVARLISNNEKRKSIMKAKVWWQHTEREIPKALFEAVSFKERKDIHLRTLLEWKQESNAAASFVRIAYLREQMNYNDAAVLLASDYLTHSYFTEGGWSRITLHPQLSTSLTIPIQYNQLFSSGNNKLGTQYRIALVNAWSWISRNRPWHIAVNGRFENFQNQWIVLPGGNFKWQKNAHQLGLQAQRTYRLPTLNELYFFPGGNVDLKPERGWAVDMWHEWKENLGAGNVSLTHEWAIYSRWMKDWIIWYGGAIWTPHNMAQVWSRGGEWKWTVGNVTNGQKCKWSITNELAYNKATTRESYFPADNSIGKQIPNTPLWKNLASGQLTLNNWSLLFSLLWTSARYITIDESQRVPEYNVLNLGLQKTIISGQNELIWSMQLTNLTNNNYQIIQGRPMPGRHIMCALSLGNL